MTSNHIHRALELQSELIANLLALDDTKSKNPEITAQYVGLLEFLLDNFKPPIYSGKEDAQVRFMMCGYENNGNGREYRARCTRIPPEINETVLPVAIMMQIQDYIGFNVFAVVDVDTRVTDRTTPLGRFADRFETLMFPWMESKA